MAQFTSQIRSHILAHNALESVSDGYALFKNSINAFLENSAKDKSVEAAIASITGENLEAAVVSRLSYKLPHYIEGTKAVKEEARLILAKTITNSMVELGHWARRSETVRTPKQGGGFAFRRQNYINSGSSSVEKELTRGIVGAGEVLSRHVSTKPGSIPVRTKGEVLQIQKEMSSMSFRLIRTTEEELDQLLIGSKAYTAAKEEIDKIENAGTRLLQLNRLNQRLAEVKQTIMALQAEEELHLSTWFDSRGRVYYDLTLWGINPHGTTGETSMWELAEPIKINKQGYRQLVWAAVVLAKGRTTKGRAYLKWLKSETEIKEKLLAEENQGKLLYNKRLLQAIEDYRTGTPSRFMLGFDATNGGLQHFACAFKGTKAMELSNLTGSDTGADAHQDMADLLNITRDQAKRINNPILHGSTLGGVARAIEEISGVEMSQEEVAQHIMSTFGAEAMNIIAIGDWGEALVTSENPTLAWKMPDGFLAQSTAYFESVEMTVYGLTKDGYNSVTVHRDMPYELTSKGEPVYSGVKPSGKSNTKVRGLYANITHSIDSYVLRSIVRVLASHDIDVLVKHDNFYTHPNYAHLVQGLYKEMLKKNFDHNLYLDAMNQIAAHHTDSPELPDLMVGNGTKEELSKATMFLMP